MNITLQQWLSRQPYTQTTDSDRYYTQLANRVYDLVNISPLKERLTEEATKSLCCDVVGYFADILSVRDCGQRFSPTTVRSTVVPCHSFPPRITTTGK